MSCLSYLISIKILASNSKILSKKKLQGSRYQKSFYEKLWSDKFKLVKNNISAKDVVSALLFVTGTR